MTKLSSDSEVNWKRLWKPYYGIYLLLVVLSLAITLLLILVLPLPLNKYRIDVRRTPTPRSAIYFFHDFDQDGFSEKVELKKEVVGNQPGTKVFTYYGNLIDQWNFQEEWFKFVIFGDFDHDHHDEAYFFTHNADSLFLYGLDIREKERFFLYRQFITAAPKPNPNKRKIWDIESIDGFLQDVDDDGFDEVVFFVNTGFSLQPRRLFAFSVRKKQIVARSPMGGSKFSRLILFDFFDDGTPEILNCFSHASDNYHHPFPFQDNASWLFLFDRKLQFVFPPRKFSPSYSWLVAQPWRFAGNTYIPAVWNYRGPLDLSPTLYLLNTQGKILREKKLAPGKYWWIISLPFKSRDHVYLTDQQELLVELNDRLETIRTFDIKGPLGTFRGEMDLDGDLQPEYLFVNDGNIWIFEKGFKYQTGFHFQLEGLFPQYQIRKRGKLPPELVFQNSTTLLFFHYYPNPLYVFRYLLVFGLFVAIFALLNQAVIFSRKILFRERFQETILQGERNGMCLLNHRGEVEHINAVLERMLMMHHHVVSGESFRETFAERPELVEFVQQLIERNTPLQKELRFTREDDPFEGLIKGIPLLGYFKLPLGYLVEIQDNRLALQADRIRVWSKTVQKMAHDIKTPLSAVQLGLQTLQMKIADLYPEATFLEGDFKLILQELYRVREMTRNFLKFSNLEEPNRQLISLKETVENALKRFNPYFNDHLKIQLELDEKHDSLWADPQQLEMVFQIIIENALDALQGKGMILISSNLAQYLDKQFQSFLEIDIADTGSGIAQEEQERVFEPYFTTKSEGTGMGLTIARKIIEDHGGEITIVSRKDFATVVRIMLPIGNIGGEGRA